MSWADDQTPRIQARNVHKLFNSINSRVHLNSLDKRDFKIQSFTNPNVDKYSYGHKIIDAVLLNQMNECILMIKKSGNHSWGWRVKHLKWDYEYGKLNTKDAKERFLKIVNWFTQQVRNGKA